MDGGLPVREEKRKNLVLEGFVVKVQCESATGGEGG